MDSARYMVIDPNGIVTPDNTTLPQNNTYSFNQLKGFGFTDSQIQALLNGARLSDLAPLEPPPFPPPFPPSL